MFSRPFRACFRDFKISKFQENFVCAPVIRNLACVSVKVTPRSLYWQQASGKSWVSGSFIPDRGSSTQSRVRGRDFLSLLWICCPGFAILDLLSWICCRRCAVVDVLSSLRWTYFYLAGSTIWVASGWRLKIQACSATLKLSKPVMKF